MYLYIFTLIYLVIISLISIAITIYDKFRALNHQTRISERALLSLALAGGAFFMYITMLLIRHKTKHHTFMSALPIMIVVHIFIIYGIYYAGI